MSIVTLGALDPDGEPEGAFLRVVAMNSSGTWEVKQLVTGGTLQVFYNFSESPSRTIDAYCDGSKVASIVNSSGFDIEIGDLYATKHETVPTGQDGTKVILWAPTPPSPGG